MIACFLKKPLRKELTMENGKFLEMWKEIRTLFEEIINKYDNIWMARERKINTRFLILFIFRLVIPKDERGYGNTLLEIFTNFFNFGIDNMPKSLAPSSICEARMKLDPFIFKELNDGIIKIWDRYNEKPFLWHGHRLYGIDGSKLSLPRELLEAGFKRPGDHVHYPQGLLSGVYDLLTGIPFDFDLVSHNNERVCALEHLKRTSEDALHVFDRGYFSFELASEHIEQKKHAIFRVQEKTRIPVIDDFWESDETDIIVMLPPPERIHLEVKMGRSKVKLESLRVRLIKYTIGDKTYVLLTTLTDKEKYPEGIFPKVYHSRWGHEEMLKVSKVITGVKDFHSKYELGVKQELFAHFIIITLLKIIESQSFNNIEEEKKNKEPPKRKLRSLRKINTVSTNCTEAPLTTPTSSCKAKKEKSTQEIKINQKGTFLSISWALEKLLFWDVQKFIEESVNFIVCSAQKLYQKLRPGRSYPRKSKTAPSKWYKGRKISKRVGVANA
jgi:hypothetical protein